MFLRTFFFATFVAVLGSSVQSATLQVEDGLLKGALDVAANGTFYDVSFTGGSCVSLFDSCDSPDDFVLQSGAEALALAQELFNSVFIDGLDGNFQSDITSVQQCGNADDGHCTFYLLYGLGAGEPAGYVPVQIFAPEEASSPPYDAGAWSNPTGFIGSDHAGASTGFIVASLLSDMAAVPLPASWWLLIGGLAGLRVMRRRNG